MKHSEYISIYSKGYIEALKMEGGLEAGNVREALIDGFKAGYQVGMNETPKQGVRND